MQFGRGLNGGGTDFSRLYCSSAKRLARLRKMTFVCLFADLASAFASIFRGLAFDEAGSPQQIARRLQAIGFDDETIRDVVEGLAAFEAWTTGHGTPHLHALLSKLHHASWFATESVQGCRATHSGTAAGTPPADVVFLLAFCRVTRTIDEALRYAGMVTAYEHIGVMYELTSAGYMDDALFPFICKAQDAVAAMSTIASVVHRVFTSHLMVLNCKKGKSEFLMAIRGPGTDALQRSVFNKGDTGVIEFPIVNGTAQIHVVLACRHVGTYEVAGDSRNCEITQRIACMQTALRTLKPRFLVNRAISIEVRLNIVRAVLFSKGLYNVSTWPKLYANEYSRMAKAVYAIYATIINSFRQILEAYGVMAPHSLLLYLRLNLFARIVCFAPASLVGLCRSTFDEPRSWLAAVHHDLKFLTFHTKRSDFHVPGDCIDAWMSYVAA